jgi:LPXTG-motif cell wall-anchored protein
VQVAGIQVRPVEAPQTLPRTGRGTVLLTQVGVGLVLLGGAAMSLGRARQAPAGH